MEEKTLEQLRDAAYQLDKLAKRIWVGEVVTREEVQEVTKALARSSVALVGFGRTIAGLSRVPRGAGHGVSADEAEDRPGGLPRADASRALEDKRPAKHSPLCSIGAPHAGPCVPKRVDVAGNDEGDDE